MEFMIMNALAQVITMERTVKILTTVQAILARMGDLVLMEYMITNAPALTITKERTVKVSEKHFRIPIMSTTSLLSLSTLSRLLALWTTN